MRIRGHKDALGLSPAEAAARWAVRHDAGDLSPEEKADFKEWLSASDANARAYEATQAAFAVFDEQHDDPHLKALKDAALAVRAPRWRRHYRAIAAGFALLIAAPTIGYYGYKSVTRASPSLYALGAADYATDIGERLTFRLPDGSGVTLNTNSELDVAYATEERRMVLKRGQAFFDVVKQSDRPFVVVAADRRITALGTSFDVRVDGDDVKVMLLTGAVNVTAQAATATSSQAPAPITMAPGEEISIVDGVARHQENTKIEQKVRWRDGLIVFDDDTLAAAANELNRYSNTRIVITEEKVADLRVSGVFRTEKPEHFLDVVDELLPVSVEIAGQNEVRLTWSGG